MTDTDTRAWLAALLGHLNQHPHLAGSLSLAHGNTAEIQLYPFNRSDSQHLAVLAEWAATLTDPQPVRITCFDRGDRRIHLKATGRLVDGTETGVVAVIRGDEYAVVAAHTESDLGATFPVDLLHQLAGQRAGVPA